ncbi:MAG: DJ-1/PfpI family protein [Candidatus Diapherotrites archaeon]
MKKAVFVVSQNMFRDEELFEAKEELDNAGIETKVASLTKETATGKLGGTVKPDLAINEISAKDFDAIVFVGGGGSTVYFGNQAALKLAREFFEKKKIVAAICIAPSILANAGILKGKKATVFGTEHRNIEEKGATYTDERVTVDGKIITANGPAAAHEFGQKIVEALS